MADNVWIAAIAAVPPTLTIMYKMLIDRRARFVLRTSVDEVHSTVTTTDETTTETAVRVAHLEREMAEMRAQLHDIQSLLS